MSASPNQTPAAQIPATSLDLRPLTGSERWCHLRRHLWESRRPQIVGTIIVLAILVLAVVLIPRLRPPAEVLSVPTDWLSWQDNLQTLFGFATFLVAGFVWYNALAEEWADKLPRLLTCYFFRDGEPALICYHAYLAGEADIRAWSQQIGGTQMTGGNIFFRPLVDTRPVELLTDGQDAYLHHQARFTLTVLPRNLVEAGQALGKSACLVWYPRREEKPPQNSSAIPAGTALTLPGVVEWPGRKT